MFQIDDLFKNVYGFKPESDEQLKTFIDCLKERLSYGEKVYVSETYHLDLFKDEEFEKRIRILMHHPLYYNEIVGHKDEIVEIFNQCSGEDVISISYIQRKYSKGFPSSKRIIDELVNRGLITPLPNGTYKVIK